MQPASSGKCVLVIDDDRLLCDIIKSSLADDTLQILVAHTGREGVDACKRHNVDIVLLDQKLPDGRGRDFFPGILKHNEQAKIIFITAFPSFDNAVKAIQLGAFDYLSKPFDVNELRLSIDRAVRTLDLEAIAQVQKYKSSREETDTLLIGTGGGLRQTHELIELASRSDAPVIITGETGTGKNVVAKSIHYSGPGKQKPILSINCAALPENLIESELFGYEKGAFTGATSTRKGIFEMADGGTLILDEIGEMPLHLQSKLLSALEEGRIKRLGGSAIRPVRVRIIAVTNIELEQAVRERRFRNDLYFRLNVIRIHVPPLRERRRDIPALCAHFLIRATNGRVEQFPDSVLRRLAEYDWPGNVRELKNIVERITALRKDAQLADPDAFGSLLPQTSRNEPACHDETSPKPLREMEKQHILYTLKYHSGNITRSAETLGISLSTLKRRLKDYGIRAAGHRG